MNTQTTYTNKNVIASEERAKQSVPLVPQLRFKEFEDDWKEILLDDFAIRGSGHTPNKSYPEYYNGNIYWISLKDSKRLDNGYIEETESKITQEGIDNSSAVLHPPGTVLLSRDAGIGKSAVMRHPMAVSQHFIVWRTIENKSSNWFLYNWLQIMKPKFERIAIGSTIKTIGLPYFKKLKIVAPDFSEQQKIASFLSAVDTKLQQLTQKKELLQQYKKGMMQKLFPSTGSGQVPQLRFKIKNEVGELVEPPDWEEKKLGDIGSTLNGLTGKTKEDFGEGKPYVQYMQIFANSKINIEQFGYVSLDEGENQTRVKYGDVFFTTSSEIPLEIGTSSVLLDDVEELYLNSFCFGYRPEIKLQPEFARYLFRSSYFRRKIIPLAQGSTRYNMSKKELLKLNVDLPIKEEQQKIASYLSALDTKIEQVAEALEATQQFKKGLLQQMFV